jgi:CheY-like chemotaxis protein
LDDPQLQKALPESLEAVQTIQNNGNYLLQLINDILDLSKIEAGKLKMERTQSSPHHLLGEVASLMRSRARDKHLFLKMAFLGDIPETIHTDPLRVRQILINLVGNAIKFTEEGGVRIQTRWNEEQQALQFEVIDTGIGISESQLNTLFQAFSQADPSTTRKFGGTGLGLNISKKMAEQLGGSITVTSVPGQGSSFSLFLPTGPREELVLVKGLREGRNISRTESLKEQNLPRLDCKVLVAEDGQDNQRLIRLILEKAGAKVEVAENGKEAIEKVFAAIEADQMFDTILMDIQMPVIDGFSATRKLREAGYTGVIIALTANAMEGAKEKCLECGCDAYVSKPITRDSFLKTIAANLPPEDVPSSPME